MSLRDKRQFLKRMNRRYPVHLVEVPRSEQPRWEFDTPPPIRVFRSCEFLVQIFDHEGAVRLSVCRTSLRDDGRWDDGISWDELQRLKREAGYGDAFAVEIFPEDRSQVNVANMRHLWILPERLPFAWGRR